MEKIRSYIIAYAELMKLLFSKIPGVSNLSEPVKSLLSVLFVWVLVPIIILSFLSFLWSTFKLIFFGVGIFVLLIPALFIWATRDKDR